MYLHLGGDLVVPFREIVGILDLRCIQASEANQAFLRRTAEAGRLFGTDLSRARALVVTVRGVYASSVSPKTLARRAQTGW
ncbi:MAG: DUF370 domain-containing protein [Armatimonadetes bacterium]|nr:DUF370 domain-containing protein [Armatimonadota bacterium]MDW8154025.1 DUF370 domain-containing protein [Armatimonadota bacterium]